MKPWSLHLVVLLSSTLIACATRPPTAGTDTRVVTTDVGCAAFPRLTYDRLHDTLATIAAVKRYDATRDKVCGVGK